MDNCYFIKFQLLFLVPSIFSDVDLLSVVNRIGEEMPGMDFDFAGTGPEGDSIEDILKEEDVDEDNEVLD